MDFFEKLNLIRSKKNESIFSERIVSEIIYLDALSKYDTGIDLALLEKAFDYIIAGCEKDGVITKQTMLGAEDILSPLAKTAKKYTELFVSHAHIDMNWMWGYNETAALTIDTFRTILDLMNEYPEFTFAQSQASTYEIVEKYRPDLLEELKKRVHEGRWEVTASEWVEPDKNMPSGESLVRQILQAKKYLSHLLEIPKEQICVDFVPDTFGHNANVPEILASAGVKYMYHCRGYDLPNIYKFQSQSGKSTINYCEYEWYNGEICTHKFEMLPDFCGKYGIDTYLVVYGVGDHGGGPTRRDLEKIIEYKSWPLTPTIRFGTFGEFFREIEKKTDSLPVVDHELNYLFTGCYTTQTRIKMANRIAEARINDAEKLAAMNEIFTGSKTSADTFDKAWRNIVFNHFHDILPGSGTVETREFALGRFQEAMGYISTSATKSMNEISEAIDTSSVGFDNSTGTTSVGAGVGFVQNQEGHYALQVAERGRGKTRAYTLFNTTQYERTGTVEITVWDYNYDINACRVTDSKGNDLPFRFSGRKEGFWAHVFNRLSVTVTVPAMGYETVIISQKAPSDHVTVPSQTYEHNDGFINDNPIVLENEYVKAVFDHRTLELISFVSKESGETLIDGKSCFFSLVHENPVYGMTAWRVGPYMSVKNLNAECDAKLNGVEYAGVYSRILYSLEFGNSRADVEITLNSGAKWLEFAIRCDWDEKPVQGKSIPQLKFSVPVSYKTNGNVLTDIPFGRLHRGAPSMDIPCQTYLMPEGDSAKQVALLADTKYGYRFDKGEASITLIRSSYDPDPYPDRGIHNIKIAVAEADADSVGAISDWFNHPVTFIPTLGHSGKLPMSASALALGGDLRLSVVKPSEDGNGLTVRVFNETDKPQIPVVSVYGRNAELSVVNSIESKKLDTEPVVDAFGTLTFKI